MFEKLSDHFRVLSAEFNERHLQSLDEKHSRNLRRFALLNMLSCKLNFISPRKILLAVYDVFFYVLLSPFAGEFTAKDSENRWKIQMYAKCCSHCCHTTTVAQLKLIYAAIVSQKSDSIKVLNVFTAIDSISKELNVYFMFNTRPHSGNKTVDSAITAISSWINSERGIN
jgi:hypothetical protein